MGSKNNLEWYSPLSPYRVLDLTNGYCLMCGKILAQLGAEVIKVENPSGDQARHTPPFINDQPDSNGSLLSLAFNHGKKDITLNIEHNKGKHIFNSLIKKSHIVIESYYPGYLDSIGLGYDALKSINPGIVLTSITAFGQTGPYSKYIQSDLLVMALSGYLSLCGDPDRPPVRISYPIAFCNASAEAAASSLTALYYRKLTGQGQRVDVSAQQVVSLLTFNAPTFWEMEKRLVTRSGPNRAEITSKAKSPQLWRCKDGWISFAIYGGQIGKRVNEPIVGWMDSEGMADEWLKGINWGELDMANISEDFFKEVQKRLTSFFLKHTKAELFDGAIARQIILFPVYGIGDILHDQQLKARDYWTQVEHLELGRTLSYPGAFAKSSVQPPLPTRRAPLLGEHNQDIYHGLLGMSSHQIANLAKEGII